ncbi:hypothetical protein [Thermaerobacter composti]|uniref:Uncharacterized protein n=1 Tax=Thermaerobacter composti TaxID=554949 RepID=A0ABZ0QNJ5_9FIRM|nr:hypothetical protein [Thermaerobacter composti]WPD18347.1 hypothetical protein Q5761_08165 [Thermaerobacter composti]
MVYRNILNVKRIVGVAGVVLAVAVVVAATAWLENPMHLYDTDEWPDESQFRSTDSVKGVLNISALVKVTDRPHRPVTGPEIGTASSMTLR